MAIDTSTWAEEHKAQFAALEASIAEEADKALLAEAKREAERLSPENQLAERKAELQAKQKAAAIASAELVADGVFRKALAEYGKERVARIFTEEGSIILRALTLAEADDYSLRAEAMQSAQDKTTICREALAESVLYPSREVFNNTTTKWPGLWAFLFMARDAMIAGIAEDTAKKG